MSEAKSGSGASQMEWPVVLSPLSPGSLRSPGLQDRSKKKPGRDIGRASDEDARLARQSIKSVADLDAAETPLIAVPEALANHAARRVGRFFHVHRAAIGRAAGGDRTTDDRATGQPGSHACGNAKLCAWGGRRGPTGHSCH